MFSKVLGNTLIPLLLSLTAMFAFTALCTAVMTRFKVITIQKHSYLLYSITVSAVGFFSIWAGMVTINNTTLFKMQKHLMEMYIVLPVFVFSPLMSFVNRRFQVSSGVYFMKALFVAILYFVNVAVFMDIVYLWRP